MSTMDNRVGVTNVEINLLREKLAEAERVISKLNRENKELDKKAFFRSQTDEKMNNRGAEEAKELKKQLQKMDKEKTSFQHENKRLGDENQTLHEEITNLRNQMDMYVFF